MKPLPTSTPPRKRGRRRLGAERGKFLPLAGGMDLLALMKDYIAQPIAWSTSRGWTAPSRGRRKAVCGRCRGDARPSSRSTRTPADVPAND